MNRNKSESAVDRLIALALDEKPAAEPEAQAANTEGHVELEAIPVFANEDLPPLPSARELEHNPMWKALLQFRVFLPYISRILEMSGPAQSSNAMSTELKQSVGDLHSSQRELRVAVQDHTVQMKRVEDALVRTHEATERNASELTELTEDVKSMHALVRRATSFLAALLFILICLVTFLLIRVPHLLR